MVRLLHRFPAVLALLALAPAAFAADAVPAVDQSVDGQPEEALARYVAKPEPAYGWKLVEKNNLEGMTLYKLEMTSQTWQDIDWQHALYVYEPSELKFHDHAILFVAGGSRLGPPRAEEQLIAVGLANLSGGRVAILKQVPNQPLFDDRYEDDLITETWLKYLQTGDANWPLLFPMVKSAVKAMDTLRELGEKEGWAEPVEKFVITGASKRGWTSWLTPVADSRVVATAPLVIDTLNFRAQMDYQIETWGEFSEQIADYTRKGLVRANGEEETPRETALRTMMDPWTYREQITIPKLVINGTNDRYWVVDAAKNYFPDLVGPKYVLQIPNAGHGLEGGHDKVVASIAALFRRVASGAELPNIEWTLEENEQGERRIVVSSNPPAHAAMLWTAVSETKDFREVKWTGRSFGGRNGTFETSIPEPRPGQGIAAFGELRFMDRTIDPPIQYSLTTTVTRFPARTEGE